MPEPGNDTLMDVMEPLTRRGFARLAAAGLFAAVAGASALPSVAARENEPGDDHGGHGADDPPGDDHGGHGADDSPGDDNGGGGGGQDDGPGDDRGGRRHRRRRRGRGRRG